MKPWVEPHFLSSVKPLETATLNCLEEQPLGAFAGISKDGRAGWIVRGALLVVVDTSTGHRLAAWQFGHVIGDQHTSVTCVKELRVGQSLKLLVGVCNATPVGLLCVFDVSLSKVIKAVEIPHPVTELELISTLKNNDVPKWALSEHLCHFCGLVAVGTNTGKVFLVDLCTDDDEFFSDEEVPSKIHFISPRIRDTENQRFQCMSQGLHLAMPLNDGMLTRNGFEYQKPDGLTMKTFPSDTVTVTCLKYIPQAGILTVGYSFGCYQLWKLGIPVLEYSSRLEPDPMPITHITYQEPENDPKNFCYIWVVRGQRESEDEAVQDTVASISMYQLAFNHRTFYSNYGVYYDELTSVCLRLDHELTSKLVQFGSNYDGNSRVLACYTLLDPHYRPPTRLDDVDSFEEGGHGPDLSLCVFVWEATEGSNSSKLGRHLGIFDINRWYHAQMPSSIKVASASSEMCAYFSTYCLDEAAERAGNDSLLTAHVIADSLKKFYTNSPVPPEQHFYPSSLAFDVLLVFESGLVGARYLGSQRQVLASMENKGPSSLVQPLELYNLCIHVGLLPRPVDVASVNMSVSMKRELLLGLALDNSMISFLKACVAAWASGEYDLQGCTLKFLLDWSWDMVSSIKHKIDSICVTLYNWSGLNLDQRSLQALIQCNQKLVHLVTLFKTFLSRSGPITEQGEAELQNKILVTSLLSQHLSVVLWFVGAGLLPEDDDTEVTLGGMYSYPAMSLMTAYKNRREELQNIHSDIGKADMLMIDGLVEMIGARDLWEREGGTGLYPPPSLHALLSSYLLDGCDMLSKHCLVLYLLLDLVSVDSAADDNTFSEKISGFAERFQLPHTLVKLIQAFWLLDHKDFEEALALLLDPLVRSEFSRWQHKRIVKALLYQGDAKMALRYVSTVRPALTTPEEVKLKLTVLLANGLIAEALEYQRTNRDKNNIHDLLSHLFLGCQQTKTVDRLLQLPLTSEEETILVDYLLESSEPHSNELLVMHYLQRARFVEAIQLNEKLKHSVLTEANSKARERAAARNAIVDSYAGILPHVQRRLMFEQLHVPKKNVQWRREVRRPTPLSTNITTCRAKVMSQSAFIMTIMEKLDEIETEEQTEVQERSVGPFICTPVTPARKSQRDTPATVYPESARNQEDGLSLNKSIGMFSSTDTPSKIDRRKSKYFSASCLYILQTPKVKKVTPPKHRLSSANVITPQSILKVRSMICTTSPSPRSASTTPNSLELDSSLRKLPRKLGYGSRSTPLSSLPRHITAEKTGSAPGSPKSVSFAEPGSPESPTDLPGPTEAATPKSASNLERSVLSVTTPKQPALKLRLQGSGHSGKLSPTSRSPPSPRSVRNRSPTPESPEKSPRLAGNLDHLQRRPLHSPQKEEELRLRMEDSDNISDEEVEEMETSGIVSAADSSVSSTATLRDQQEAEQSVSPASHRQQKPSPLKSPASPTVKVSKSPVSVFASADDRKSSTEHAQMEVSSTQQNGTQEAAPETGLQRVDVDLTAEDEMEMEQEDMEMPTLQPEVQITQNREIFETSEEISPPGEIEEISPPGEIEINLPGEIEINPPGEIEEEVSLPVIMEEISPNGEPSTQGEMETVTSKELPLSIKQEVEEELPSPPKPTRHLTPPEAPLEQVSGSPGSQQTSPVKDSPPDTDYSVQAQTERKRLEEIERVFDDSPDVEKIDNVVNQPAGLKAKGRRTRKTFVMPVIKFDQDQAAGSREPESEGLASETEGAPASPVKREREASQVPETPTRSSRRLREKVKDEAHETQEEPVTPTRRSTRLHSEQENKPVTPTRSGRRKSAKTEGKSEEQLVEISATSPKRFSKRAKEAVQEALLNISAEMKEELTSSPGEMTKIKDKSKSPARAGSRSPARTPTRSPARTPTRSRRGQNEAVTPTRTSARLASMNEDNKNDENLPATPSRQTPSRSKKTATPRRGRLKTETELSSPEKDVNENNSSAAKDISCVKKGAKESKSLARQRKQRDAAVIEAETEGVPKSPVKKLIEEKENVNDDVCRDSFGASDIPETFEEMEGVETTPSRRKSLNRACKKSVSDVDIPKTPTRRQSLGRDAKLGENVEIVRTPTRRQSLRLEKTSVEDSLLVRTPTRRQSLGRSAKIEEVDENILKTPTRRQSLGRAVTVKSEKSPEKDMEKSKTDEKEEKDASPVRTPSRRGHSRKTESFSSAVDTETKGTPSRRGRRKKTEDGTAGETETKARTPRRGKGEKSSSESDGETADEKTRTPGRRGKKSDMESAIETNAEKTRTPSRRRRKKSHMESEGETTDEKTRTHSRSGKKSHMESEGEMTDEKTRIPSRGRGSRSGTESEGETTDEKTMTPSRKRGKKSGTESEGERTDKKTRTSSRGRGKKLGTESKGETTDEKTRTSSRGRGRKSGLEMESESETEQDSRVRSSRATRRKHGNASEEEGSPAAHTRSHDSSDMCAASDFYDIHHSSFKFSDPVPVDAKGAEDSVKSFTPVKSFIFSPPISRERSKAKQETEVQAEGILLPPGPSSTQAATEGKPDKRRKKKRLYEEREDILLISPLAAGAEDSGEEGRSIFTGTRKVTVKKEGKKLQVQSVGRRQTRSSYRFGPVGKKAKK